MQDPANLLAPSAGLMITTMLVVGVIAVSLIYVFARILRSVVKSAVHDQTRRPDDT